MKKYYVHDGLIHEGPFELEELKTKGITYTTHVWHEGLSHWKIAGEVEELKSLMSTVPPPFIEASDLQALIPPAFEPNYFVPEERSKKPMIIAGVATVFTAVLLLVFVFNST